MKTFILLLSLVITLTTAEWKLKSPYETSEIVKACRRRYDLSNEVKFHAETQKYPPIEVIERVMCSLRGFGVWTDTEGFNTDRIMIAFEHIAKAKNLDRKAFRKNLENCLDDNSQGSPPMEWAQRSFNCFIDNSEFFKLFTSITFHTEGEEED